MHCVLWSSKYVQLSPYIPCSTRSCSPHSFQPKRIWVLIKQLYCIAALGANKIILAFDFTFKSIIMFQPIPLDFFSTAFMFSVCSLPRSWGTTLFTLHGRYFWCSILAFSARLSASRDLFIHRWQYPPFSFPWSLLRNVGSCYFSLQQKFLAKFTQVLHPTLWDFLFYKLISPNSFYTVLLKSMVLLSNGELLTLRPTPLRVKISGIL